MRKVQYPTKAIPFLLIALIIISFIPIAIPVFAVEQPVVSPTTPQKSSCADKCFTPATETLSIPSSKIQDSINNIYNSFATRASAAKTVPEAPARKELKEFNVQYGGKWYVEEDKRTGIPKRIEGGRIPVSSINSKETIITKEGAFSISQEFL